MQQTLLPLGSLRKEQVRHIAARLTLRVAEKPESQELCFIPDGDCRHFLRPRLTPEACQAGSVVNSAGWRLSTHQGIAFLDRGAVA